MLDDFFFIGVFFFFECYSFLFVFYVLVKDIGLLIKLEKIVYFIIILIFLGFELDIV